MFRPLLLCNKAVIYQCIWKLSWSLIYFSTYWNVSQHILLAYGIVIFHQVKRKEQGGEKYFPLTGTEVTVVELEWDTKCIEKRSPYQCFISFRITKKKKKNPCLAKVQISIPKCHLKFSHALDMTRALSSVWELHQGTQYKHLCYEMPCVVLSVFILFLLFLLLLLLFYLRHRRMRY